MKESEDHEVGMAMGQLEAMFKAIQELEDKIAKDGFEERDLPGWIQSHITSAYEYIKQANDNFHELGENITPAAIGGMGPVQLPGNGTIGSGDVPAGQGDAEEEYKKKKKTMEKVMTFEAFVKTSLDESKKDKIYMALGDMEDWMPADSDVQDEYYAITNVKDMADFFEEYADTDVLQDYGLTYRDLKDLAKAALNSNESKRQAKVNEEYVELPSIDVPSTDLIEAFKQWYKDTADNWEDFKNDMAEDSVDEAAKNAQMEILANLSNEMNLVIKDRKFKVRADFK